MEIRMRNLGPRIRALRTERQITLPQLADRAGLSKGLLSKLENDEESNPSITTLFKIAEALEITLADILETEQAQIRRIIPDQRPEWLEGLIAFLVGRGEEPDTAVLDAIYVLRNRKASAPTDLEYWKFVYRSIQNSFRE
ncbi:MAG: helix-turn-helix transcriptional regulator [Verrucomicrobiota bacterium]